MPGVALPAATVVPARAPAVSPASECADLRTPRRVLTLSAQFGAVGRLWLPAPRQKRTATPSHPLSKHKKLVLAKISNQILSSNALSGKKNSNTRRAPSPPPACQQQCDEVIDLIRGDSALDSLQIQLGTDGIPSYLDLASTAPVVENERLQDHEKIAEHATLMIQTLWVVSYEKLRERNLPLWRKVVIGTFIVNKLESHIN